MITYRMIAIFYTGHSLNLKGTDSKSKKRKIFFFNSRMPNLKYNRLRKGQVKRAGEKVKRLLS